MEEKFEVVLMEYLPEKVIRLKCREVNPKPYLTNINGFKMVEYDGEWMLLTKKDAVLVTVHKIGSKGQEHLELKEQICNFYGEEYMSEELFSRFYEDVSTQKITVSRFNGKMLLIRR